MFATCSTSLKISPGIPNQATSNLIPTETEWEQPSEITHLSWSKDNTYIAVLREAKRPQILSVANLNSIRIVTTIPIENVSCLAFKHKSKRFLAIGTKTGGVVLYDTESKKVTKNFGKLFAPIQQMEFGANDVELAVICEDTAMVFCSETNGTNKYKHNAKCCSLKFHPTAPHQLAVGCSDGCVTLWDTKTSTKLYYCQLHSQAVRGLCLPRNEKQLISIGDDKVVHIVDLNSEEQKIEIELNQTPTSICLKHDDAVFGVGFADGTVQFYQKIPAVTQLSQSQLHKSSVNVILFTNNVEQKKRIEQNVIVTKQKQVKTDELNQVKKELIDFVQKQTEDLEKQLQEHIRKFRVFMENEFRLINETLKDKWDMFIQDENLAS